MYSALTNKPTGGGLRNSIISYGCLICDLTLDSVDDLQKVSINALWDTGATNCVITQRIVDALGLLPITHTQVHDASGMRPSLVYAVTLILPNMRVDISFATLGIIISADMLIGMDVINLGDFAITNKNNNTIFSFRMPSQKHIDYVEEFNKEAVMKAIKSKGYRIK